MERVDDQRTRYEDAIRRVAVLRAATSDDVREMARLAIERAVGAGGYFFIQGDKAENLCILLQGRGEAFGEAADMQCRARSELAARAPFWRRTEVWPVPSLSKGS